MIDKLKVRENIPKRMRERSLTTHVAHQENTLVYNVYGADEPKSRHQTE